MNHNQSKKDKKKAQKKLLDTANVKVKPPSQSKKPAMQIAKNSLSSARMLEAEHMLSSQVQKIILAIAAPKEFPAVRLGSNYGSFPTAVANPYSLQNVAWNSDGSAYAFLFRDPYRFFVTPILLSPNTVVSYQYVYGTNGSVMIGSGQNPLPGYPLTPSANSAAPHGQVWYPGRFSSSGRSYWWMSLGTASLTNPSGSTLRVYWYVCDANGNEQLARTQDIAPNATSTFPFIAQTYAGVDVAVVGSAGEQVTSFQGILRFNETGDPTNPFLVMSHRAIPFMSNNSSSSEAIKLYGASIMFTNEASPLNRQGKLCAAQIPQGRDWRNYTTYNQLAGIRDAYTDTALNGYYGFLKPTQPRDVDFIENNSISNGSFQTGWWDMNVPSDFLAFVAQVTDPNGRDAYWTYSASFEYRTSDQWRETKQPSNSPEAVLKAMSLISRIPQFHENPLHFSDIVSWVKQTVSDIWQGFKEALPVVVDVASKTAAISSAIIPLL